MFTRRKSVVESSLVLDHYRSLTWCRSTERKNWFHLTQPTDLISANNINSYPSTIYSILHRTQPPSSKFSLITSLFPVYKLLASYRLFKKSLNSKYCFSGKFPRIGSVMLFIKLDSLAFPCDHVNNCQPVICLAQPGTHSYCYIIPWESYATNPLIE